MSGDHLGEMLSEVGESVTKCCYEPERYKEAHQRHEKIEEELGNVLTKEQSRLLYEYNNVTDEIISIISDYRDKAVFFYGMEIGLMFASYKEAGAYAV